jgi:Fis family transcriptional regulator
MSQPLAPSIEQNTDVITNLDVHSTALPASEPSLLRDAVRATVKEYFIKLDGATPQNFYELFLTEIELPLLEIVLQYTGKNQSTAAKLLNISRGTLRKKMQLYGLLKDKK